MQRLLILILFSSISWTLNAQISVEARLDSTVMLIGDQTDLHLRVTSPPNVAVQYPIVTAEQLGDLEIVKTGKLDTLSNAANQLVTQQNITVTAFDSGFYRIPELAFKAGGRTLRSKPLELQVSTLQIDSTFIAPIKPIKNVPITMREIAGMLGTLVAIGALVALLVWWLRRRNQKEPEPEVVYVPPAHVTALEKMNLLEKEKLWQQDKTKPYYTKLTYIFREYLENRYGVNALESTTDEIVSWLRREKFSDDLTTKLRNTLQASDLVKFAKSKPGVDIHQNAMDTAYEFIHATKKDLTEEDEAQLAQNTDKQATALASDATAIIDTPTIIAPSNPPLKYAGFFVRLAAMVIDSVIVFTVFSLLTNFAFYIAPMSFAIPMITMLGGMIASLLYFVIMEASARQGTIGKRILKLKVVDRNGQRISIKRSLGRTLFKLISGIILNLGYLWALFNKKRKTWHDIVAGTLVVSTSSPRVLTEKDEQQLKEM